MSDELLKSVRQMAKEGKLPEEITPDLTFAAIADTNRIAQEIGQNVEEIATTVQEIKTNDLPHIEAKVDAMAQIQSDNPSLVYLLRYRTGATVKKLLIVAGVVVLVAVVVATFPPLRDWLIETLTP